MIRKEFSKRKCAHCLTFIAFGLTILSLHVERRVESSFNMIPHVLVMVPYLHVLTKLIIKGMLGFTS